jgi:uncharacterized protein (DUF302 family)
VIIEKERVIEQLREELQQARLAVPTETEPASELKTTILEKERVIEQLREELQQTKLALST